MGDSYDDIDALCEDEIEIIRETQSQCLIEPPPELFLPDTSQDVIVDPHDTRTPQEVSRKRNIEEVSPMKEIQLPVPKKLKSDDNENIEKFALIKHILMLRKQHEMINQNESIDNAWHFSNAAIDYSKFVTLRYPRYSCLPITCADTRVGYIKYHSEDYALQDIKYTIEAIHCNDGSRLRCNHKLWQEVQQLQAAELLEKDPVESTDTDLLWTDAYKPKKYIELISDESTNRTLLNWIKLWDKVVFNKRIPKIKSPLYHSKTNFTLESDERDRPKLKLALLAGAPGLGKTTLTHVLAYHAGYKPVEINASDERNVDQFRTILENATTMSSVLDQNQRPNCLIFDEIDGAPKPTIDFLIKYATGEYKGKGMKKPVMLKRPIICICNDLYVPALRVLRQHAIVLHMPPVQPPQLSVRLKEIATREGIVVSEAALIALSEKTRMDVRLAVSSLQLLKDQKDNTIKLEDVLLNESICKKDVRKSLFRTWKDVFTLSKNAMTPHERRGTMLQSIHDFGDFDKLAAGVYENYPKFLANDWPWRKIWVALDWLSRYDVMQNQIGLSQNYSLASYFPYGLVVWHFMFAAFPSTTFKMDLGSKKGPPKLKYPTVVNELRNKRTKLRATLADFLHIMPGRIRAYLGPISLLLDVIPLLQKIITPALRPLNLQLLSPKERTEMARVVDVMIDYSLTYVQERQQDGGFACNLDPNITEFCITSETNKNLINATKQLIAAQVEVEKIRRLEPVRGDVRHSTGPRANCENVIPNHLQTLKPVHFKLDSVKLKPHFGKLPEKHSANTVEQTQPPAMQRNCIYYRFKEGFTNAVRKPITISELLK